MTSIAITIGLMWLGAAIGFVAGVLFGKAWGGK